MLSGQESAVEGWYVDRTNFFPIYHHDPWARGPRIGLCKSQTMQQCNARCNYSLCGGGSSLFQSCLSEI